MESLTKLEDVTDEIPSFSDPLQPKVKSTFYVLKLATREQFFVMDVSFN